MLATDWVLSFFFWFMTFAAFCALGSQTSHLFDWGLWVSAYNYILFTYLLCGQLSSTVVHVIL